MPISTAIESFGPLASPVALLAYLDPGTGSYALQLLLAGLFGGMFALKQSWQQCRGWLAQGPLARLRGRAVGSAD